MKLFTIAAAVLLRCIHSSEAAAPKLRANMKDASSEVEDEVVESKKNERTTAAAEVSSPCRKRISQYVSGGQMFFIVANQTIVLGDPSTDPFTFTNIYWMCQPTVAPDLNGDGMYDSVASRVNIYIPPKTLKAADNAGVTGLGKFTTHGYTASWVKQGEGGYYNEHVVDFGDTTVWQINGKEFIGYETSPRGTTGGLVASGEGLWTMDKSNPLLQELAKAIGKDLTPETCAERYAETWKESHSSSIEVEE
eukprot:scaffold14154_cov114-Skeletonema_dohrnii-CCMP3373.AAC.1